MHRVETARMKSGRKKPSSFTLVELLTVIAIIAILVAITLQAASGVMASAARSRAKSEVQAMTTALESYKTDNGAYPQANTMTTNGTSPTYISCDGSGTSTNYTYSSQVLYQALSGKTNYLDTPVAGVKSYMSFKVGQLGNSTAEAGTSATGGSCTYLADPWGYSYGYNTGSVSGASTTNYPYNGNGFFDLWSTGGLITSSSNFTNTAAWICNWQ